MQKSRGNKRPLSPEKSAVGATTFEVFPDPLEVLLLPGYELIPQLNEVYELQLAFAESKILPPEELIRRGAYFKSIHGEFTHHFLMCTGAPLQVAKQSSMRLRTFFEANLFKTGYATHGLFPYRGKFHPQMIKALMNIIGVKEGETVLDPMMGCGTTLIEAVTIGVHAVGYEISPFCTFMARAKLDGLDINVPDLKKQLTLTDLLFYEFEKHAADIARLASLAAPITGSLAMDRLLTLCYFDAIGFARRTKQKGAIELFGEILKKYLLAVEKFYRIRKNLNLKLGKAEVKTGDARALDLKDESIAGVIFSPPYSVSIDYVENDRLQLELMGIDVEALRQDMVGLRGKTEQERVTLYFDDMAQVLQEVARVLMPGRYCVIVVGSNEKQLQRILSTTDPAQINIEDRLARLGEKAGMTFVKKIERQITGLYNVMRNEYLVLLRK